MEPILVTHQKIGKGQFEREQSRLKSIKENYDRSLEQPEYAS